jgi:hypothetical protein
MKKILFLAFILIFSISCSNLFKRTVQLPVTKTPESINEWAVLKLQNNRMREEPTEEGKAVTYIPLGKIVKVLKKDKNLTKFENNENYWFFVDYNGEKGWLFGAYIDIYNDYNGAFKRSEEILLNISRKKN